MREGDVAQIELNSEAVIELEFVTLPSELNTELPIEYEKNCYPDFFEDVVFTHCYVW